MQLSPLQLDEMRFLGVRIECRETPELREQQKKFESFAFENTKFTSALEHICADDDVDSLVTNFAVTLTISLPNEGENPSPYIVDVKCVGYFSISKEVFPDFERRYDIGVVNGASLLYGAIREMISSVTARAWYGQLLLPSLNFQANAPSKGNYVAMPKNEPPIVPASKPKPRKKSTKALS